MAVTPSMAQIAGAHLSTYEALFHQVDTKGTGVISALDAATFLKKSGLSVGVLSQVWELADSAGRGVLDRHGFFVALKLIALTQNGKEMSLANLALQVPPPTMGTPASPAIVPLGSEGDNWAIHVTERAKYDHIFEGLQPINGMLTGDKVRPVLLNSGLAVDVLGRVWDLSDIDEDGFLDREEFAVAMHLVYKALEKQPVPMTLPPNVIPPSKRKKTVIIPGAIRVLPPVGVIASPPPSAGLSINSPPPMGIGRGSPNSAAGSMVAPVGGPSAGGWVVTPVEKAKYEEMFIQIDADMDGLVNGVELREIFLQSGLSQPVLAHIWNLCDMRGVGQLNLDQFCLAMHLVQQKLTGVDPPQTLPSNMVPPSMRGPGVDGTVACSDTKELEMISKEIDELKMKKMTLEQEKAQKEADIKISNSEVLALQKEFDAISCTVKQLETQKCEAQKRLDELDDKRRKLENLLLELKDKCQEELKTITNLKSRISNQETDEKTQEETLKRTRDELNGLREQEASLEEKLESRQLQLSQLSKNLETVMQEVTQAKANIRNLQENQGTTGQSTGQLVNGNTRTLTPSDPDQFSTKATAGSSPISNTSGFSSVSGLDDDPFKSKDPFANVNGDTSTAPSDPFADEDPFKNTTAEDPFKGSDPFHGETFAAEFDPFGADPFKDSFPGKDPTSELKTSALSSSNTSSPKTITQDSSSKHFTGDPFGKDPFAAAFSSMKPTTATNDPFASSMDTEMKSPADFTVNDPFGTDPFAPTSSTKPKQTKSPAPPRPKSKSPAIGRNRSPVPSLPPKHKKAPPPPRPPAPKPSPGSGKPALDPFEGNDPFGGNAATTKGSSGDPFGGNFADFGSSKIGGGAGTDEIAWATKKSQEEYTRQKQLEEQEQADLDLAIALSKADMT